MTWVKICGMTNLEDALAAVDAGADAVGFVFYEKSPRNVSLERAREIVQKLPESIEKVGVFVDLDAEPIRRIVLQVGLTAVQLHGRVSLDSVWKSDLPTIETVGVAKIIPMIYGDVLQSGTFVLGSRALERTFAVLFDSKTGDIPGGTGTTFDWDATKGMVQCISLTVPVIVAGGLTSGNVSEAMRKLQPFGVDVVSGVEASPGKKSSDKVRAFVKAVREFDRKVG